MTHGGEYSKDVFGVFGERERVAGHWRERMIA